ncbi:YhcN/YlaJ family sporulation lipoprotein [Halobacillus yeomjeoni]|uniref:YhcN/YlaJ family sporulation lipoprotein n=1 Tax=Halobacillus yeomjeoni TaxID=311194 RepID=UPI001CD762BE|nr:YhcN/YlaJ family sporulation lipoprotein [Halobacillus yeomjeoni]MCA0982622.1 YhcN/YlaJ family sporulation lipoprotein [Halobacillus yeomjeoni]
MWKLLLCLTIPALFLTACNQGNQEEAENKEENVTFYQPLEYTEGEAIERRGKIPTGKDSYFKRTAEEENRNAKYNKTNRSHDNDFNNEDAMAILDNINELKEVTMSQVFTTEDKVYVAVMINPYDRRNHSIPGKIQSKVEELTDKKVIIWTNNNNWDNMKDLNARLKASQAPEKVKNRIREFFNQGASN